MAFKDGTKSGGKKKGSRNKSTLARLTAIQEAAKLMANFDGSGVFTGDGHALLVAIYKNEKFPIELRADCAKAAIRYEKPALSAVENTGDIQSYVTRMPMPVASLDEWMNMHMEPDKTPEDPTWTEKMEKIRREAEAKKGQLQ